jgi:protein-S-isoprenylcysteine O-methyltransferase Ste14
MTRQLAVAAMVCWGLVAGLWVLAARPGGRSLAVRRPSRSAGGRAIPDVVLVGAIAAALGIGCALSLAAGASWLEAIGLCLLVAATAFTAWARLVLGAMWSVQAKVGAEHTLRTSGPYAVTRHPIYTGMLGMLIGTSLLIGPTEMVAIVLLVGSLVEVKILREERLLLTTFPDAYEAYRRRVPQLVPGLGLLRRGQREMREPSR